MGLNRISRAKRDQTWREDIITTGISRVEGIAVDWIAGKEKKMLAFRCPLLIPALILPAHGLGFSSGTLHISTELEPIVCCLLPLLRSVSHHC